MEIDGTARLPAPAVPRVEKPRIVCNSANPRSRSNERDEGARNAGEDERLFRSGTGGAVPHLVLPLSAFAAQFIGQLLSTARLHPAEAVKSYRQQAPAGSPAPLRTI